MAGFALDLFERQAEAFLQARTWREWLFLTGQRPGRTLLSLYEQDYPDFTSTDFWADLQAAQPDDPRQHRTLSTLLAMAYLEGRTRDLAVQVTRVEAGARVAFEDQDLAWREVPAYWSRLAEVPRRHELAEAWRSVFRTDLNPVLQRWQEALRRQLPALGGDTWLDFWNHLLAIPPGQPSKLAEVVLQTTGEVYGHGLSIYLGQLELPIDDAWTADLDWAFRATRFDAVFPERNRMPLLIRVLRDLGVELTEQTSLHLEYGALPGVRCLALNVPGDVHVLQHLGGGWQDYAHSLRGLGMAEHLVHADPSLRFTERWPGDETPTLGYGLLLEGLVRDRTWLVQRLEYTANDDFVIISHLASLSRIRRLAATAQYEHQLWQAEPGASMAATFEELLSSATRTRQFPDEYLSVLLGLPQSTFSSAFELRAAVFAAQLRAFLRREFDQEWWRSNRAAKFIKDDLWRPGRRHTAEELLEFMGYQGFDPAILASEFEEVLRPL